MQQKKTKELIRRESPIVYKLLSLQESYRQEGSS